ncbi:MAG TPA: cytochrome c biogenesis protein CcsA [Acidimicrobiia bacterium]|nr:cytochrome c biogenesis protein CcsA [Acidimicrobiia bacterium]
MNQSFASRLLDFFERRLLAEGVLRALGVIVVLALGVLVVLGLWVAPPDVVQGDAQRLMYVHVPTAIMAFAAFAVTTGASILYLWRRTRDARWDRLAAVSAELGVLFTSVTLVLGMLWGRPVWGVYWTWDARLITTAVLLFLWLGYLALRRMIADPGMRARRCAVAAIVAFIDVPIVQLSVEWWRSLHQQSTLATIATNDPQIEGTMLVALLWSLGAFGLAYLYLLARRYQLAVVEEGIEDRLLDAAIAERRAEADFSPPLSAIEAEVG